MQNRATDIRGIRAGKGVNAFEEAVVLVVVVAVAVAAAFWLANIATQQTGLEILDLKASASRSGGKTVVTVYAWNRGTKPATIVAVKVNGQVYEQRVAVEPGSSASITVEAPPADALEVVVVTASGREYPLIVAP